MTWCLWSCPEPEQSWAFPKRLGLFQRGLITINYHFQKLIESPTTVRQKEKGTYRAPGTTSRGRAALQVPFWSRRLRRGHIGPRGSPMWGRAASRVPLVPRTTLSRTGCIPAAPNRKWFFGGKKKTTLRKVTSLALLNPYNSSTTLQFEAQSS